MNIDRSKVAQRLAELRKDRGFSSKADFARSIGCDPARYWDYESGRRLIPVALAVATGASLDWLYRSARR